MLFTEVSVKNSHKGYIVIVFIHEGKNSFLTNTVTMLLTAGVGNISIRVI